MFRGREMAHTSYGRAVLDRILKDIEAEAVVEQNIRMEGKNMTLLLGPKAKA
jgi:translation initiation factor IF-3